MQRALLALALVMMAAPASAQYRRPRSADYLFVASAQDARALWVNPAGLGVGFDASIMAEIHVDRMADGALGLGQLGLGFNSRGLSFGFRRDRLSDTLSMSTFRLGAARALGRLAVGASLTLYTNAAFGTQREVDLGLRYLLVRGLEAGLVARHIGKPTVIDSLLGPSLAAGVAWAPVSLVALSAEVETTDRNVGSGVLNAYRAGIEFGLGRLPATLTALLEFDHDVEPAFLTLALSVGLDRRLVAVGGERLRDGTVRGDALSLVGLAFNRFADQRR